MRKLRALILDSPRISGRNTTDIFLFVLRPAFIDIHSPLGFSIASDESKSLAQSKESLKFHLSREKMGA